MGGMGRILEQDHREVSKNEVPKRVEKVLGGLRQAMCELVKCSSVGMG